MWEAEASLLWGEGGGSETVWTGRYISVKS